MKRFLIVVSLAGALSTPALAGEVPTVGFVPPTPPVITGTTHAPSQGEGATTSVAQQLATDAIVTIMLTIFGLGR